MKVYVTLTDNKEFDSLEEAIFDFKMFNSEREILEAILAGENEVVILKNCRIFATKKNRSLLNLCELLNIDRETLDF